MQNPGSGIPEARYGMSFGMNSGDTGQDLYGHSDYVLHAHHTHNPAAGHNQMLSPTHGSKRTADVAGLVIKQDPMTSLDPLSGMGLSHSTTPSIGEEGLDRNGPQTKKTPPPNGKKTKGRVKIKMEFIDNKLRRYTTFSKRKTGIMKKAYELSTLTGTQVMLLVASETGHVYTFATRKLQPMITSDAGKALIQTCLNSPDPPATSTDQRMSATGFEETELTYTVHDEDQKVRQMMYTGHIPPSHPHSMTQSPHPSHSHAHSHSHSLSHHHALTHPHTILGPPLASPYPSHSSPSPGPSSHHHHQHYASHGLASPGGAGMSPAPTPPQQHPR
nr:serum response factor [Triops longicaudatus]